MNYELASYFMFAMLIISIAAFAINERYWKNKVRNLEHRLEYTNDRLSEKYADGYNDALSDSQIIKDEIHYEVPSFIKGA